VTIWSTNSHL